MTVEQWFDALRPHMVAVAVIGARLVPVGFMCPFFGGAQAPTHVKLGVVLALSIFLHSAGGVGHNLEMASALELVAMATQELMYGVSLGLMAGLPFDAARMSGRMVDMFRGSSAEAALPMAGSKEAASGDGLYHLLLAMGASGALMPLVWTALAKSYALAPLGWFRPTEANAAVVVQAVSGALSTAFALGGPVAALALLIDLGLGLASRGAPNMNLSELGTPLRILGGGAVLWLVVGLMAGRLQDFAFAQAAEMRALAPLLGGP